MKIFKKKQAFKFEPGFTLIELLVVSSIIVILSVIILANYELGNYRLNLDRSLHKLTQDIRKAEEMAMSSNAGFQGCSPNSPKGYGVYFDIQNSTTTYILFADCSATGQHDAQSATIETTTLEEGIFLSALWPPAGSNQLSIVFKAPDPTVCIVDCTGSNDQSAIYLGGRGGFSGEVLVNKRGLIEIQ
jgi:prepilin-type N-terminal cleavage/methylation domain-containing protein